MNADPPAPEPPQVFERVGRAQLAGCVAYLLMIPAFIIVAGLIAGILGAGITQLLKMGETASLVLCLILAGLSMIAAGYFGVRPTISSARATSRRAGSATTTWSGFKPSVPRS
jgi:hypothetical protein